MAAKPYDALQLWLLQRYLFVDLTRTGWGRVAVATPDWTQKWLGVPRGRR